MRFAIESHGGSSHGGSSHGGSSHGGSSCHDRQLPGVHLSILMYKFSPHSVFFFDRPVFLCTRHFLYSYCVR